MHPVPFKGGLSGWPTKTYPKILKEKTFKNISKNRKNFNPAEQAKTGWWVEALNPARQKSRLDGLTRRTQPILPLLLVYDPMGPNSLGMGLALYCILSIWLQFEIWPIIHVELTDACQLAAPFLLWAHAKWNWSTRAISLYCKSPQLHCGVHLVNKEHE